MAVLDEEVIRVVAQHTPDFFAILGLADPEELPNTIRVDHPEHGGTYYRAQSKDHFVLYKRAISGSGAGGTFDTGQR